MTDSRSASISKNNYRITRAARCVALFSFEEINMNNDYKTVAMEANDEFVEKRSRFIGYVKPVKSEQEAIDFINQKRSEHWNATHNVYAYSLREGNIKRYSDDGEPSGTAGMPVLDVIVKNEIYDVCVVVTRYFGGVLLGTGGLVRAYSQGAKIALESGNIVLMRYCLLCEARCTYNQYGKVSSLIMESGAEIDDTVYETDVLIKFHIKPELITSLNKKLADATSGEVTVSCDETKTEYFMSDIN